MQASMTRFASIIQKPVLHDPGQPWDMRSCIDGLAYQKLAHRLRISHGEEAVLLPLIFHSDETSLALFNSTKDNSNSYPAYVANGKDR